MRRVVGGEEVRLVAHHVLLCGIEGVEFSFGGGNRGTDGRGDFRVGMVGEDEEGRGDGADDPLAEDPVGDFVGFPEVDGPCVYIAGF